jgi:hypothetical protein
MTIFRKKNFRSNNHISTKIKHSVKWTVVQMTIFRERFRSNELSVKWTFGQTNICAFFFRSNDNFLKKIGHMTLWHSVKGVRSNGVRSNGVSVKRRQRHPFIRKICIEYFFSKKSSSGQKVLTKKSKHGNFLGTFFHVNFSKFSIFITFEESGIHLHKIFWT